MRAPLLRNAICLWALATPLLAQQPILDAEQYRYESQRAWDTAEGEVRGEAVSARLVELNGATGGWEVRVYMRNEARGWKVLIDRDTWTVRWTERIPNP